MLISVVLWYFYFRAFATRVAAFGLTSVNSASDSTSSLILRTADWIVSGIAVVALIIIAILVYLRYWSVSISSARKFERQLQKSLTDYGMALREDGAGSRKSVAGSTAWGPRLVFSAETAAPKWREAWDLYREEAFRRRFVSTDKAR